MKTDYYSKDTDLKHRELSREEEQALFARFHAGDLAAGNEIIENNLRYTLSLALRHSKQRKYHAEMISAANYGLVVALHLRQKDGKFAFDPARGRFTTFATKFIIGEMCKCHRVSGGVSFPAGRLPDWPENRLDTDPDEFADQAGFNPESIDHEALFGALDTLPENERQAIELLFFGGKTFNETAAILGVTRQTAHLIKNRAMEKLRTRLDGCIPAFFEFLVSEPAAVAA